MGWGCRQFVVRSSLAGPFMPGARVACVVHHLGAHRFVNFREEDLASDRRVAGGQGGPNRSRMPWGDLGERELAGGDERTGAVREEAASTGRRSGGDLVRNLPAIGETTTNQDDAHRRGSSSR